MHYFIDPATSTLTYLLVEPGTAAAIIIDPVRNHVEDYMACINENRLILTHTLETHTHADHISGSGLLHQATGAIIGVNAACGIPSSLAALQLKDNDIIRFGDKETIRVIATPGHTSGCTSYLWRNMVFTGDALFRGGCGRTDFQGGNPHTLYRSITEKLFTLPPDTLMYPGHDYSETITVRTIGHERDTNPRLAGKSEDEFVAIMNGLNLPHPKQIDIAVPANNRCGMTEDEVKTVRVAGVRQ